ncbi:MAG TPA: TrkH family potassium uptake protein [Bacteroidetes bacterium]|nr:TrkH family potassium uptake protein [Bacteroidota bacterium]
MNYRPVLAILGIILVFVGLFMIFPILFSIYYGEDDLHALVLSMIITLTVGAALWGLFRKHRDIRIRESYAIVTFSWVVAAGFGALPFVISGYIPSYTNAFFETMSGFTTTGASILADIERLPHGLLFWRSLTHWLGGMGIIVLSLAILPLLGIGGMQLFKAEIPGPVAEKLTPRIQQTAKMLWIVYALISLAETVLLLAGGMSLFEALCHTFGTMATGGFSPKNSSIAYYDSAFIQYVIIFFMVVAGSNFALHYHALKGNFKVYWQNEEFRFYVGIMSVFVVLLTLDNLFTIYPHLWLSLRHSMFQVVSITTTTGFVTADYEKWSSTAQFILLFLMFIGGSAGSTGGSIKILRVMILLKQGYAEVRHLLHPRAVIPVRINRRVVPPNVIINVLGFTFLYISIFVAASIVMTLLDLDLITAFASVAATLGNIGPGLGLVGPTDHYAHIPTIGKWILSFCMLAGRLEIYTVVVLFTREFWKK